MTYREALDYLDSFVNYESIDRYDYKSSFQPGRMKALAAALGDPQASVPSLHIAGTKGKGSTAVFVYSILREAGFRAGLYTSPHLVSFRERIRINGELISEDDIARLLERVRRVVDGFSPDDKPSFFEIYTALAYLYFRDKKADIAVYETGLGGRLDATNIITPLACAITPISYEHTQKLGSSLGGIASEKAGIIKEGAICVSAPQEREALAVIREACAGKNASLVLVGADILFEEVDSGEEGEVFNVMGLFAEYPLLRTRLLGPHQVVNAATAVGLAEALRMRGVTIHSGAIRDGIGKAAWSGRMEVVGRDPLILLDGAQNRSSAGALSHAVRKIFRGGSSRRDRLILVLGVSKDKDIKGIMEELLPISDSVILTRSRVAQRALEPERMLEFIPSGRLKGAVLTGDVGEALRLARSSAGQNDMILVTGSLFVVGEAGALIRGDGYGTT